MGGGRPLVPFAARQLRRVGAPRAAAALATGLAAGLAGAALVAPMPAAAATPPTSVRRLAGADAASTAAAVSADTYKPGVLAAYVATDADYPDALAGGAVAGGQGPILYTTTNTLPAATATELKRLTPKRIVVLGGPAAVSDSVVTSLQSYTSGTVNRLAGSDRYATAAAVSRATFSAGPAAAYVATGENFPDALAGATVAAGRGPVLLVTANSVPSVTVTELQRLSPHSIVILGGTAAVSASVESTLQSYTSGTVSRLAGADRYGTAAAVAKTVPLTTTATIYLATGEDFHSPLAAAPAAATRGAPLLLMASGPLPASTSGELGRRGALTVVVVGDTTEVSDTAVSDAVAAANPVVPSSPGAQTAVTTAQAQIGKPYQWGGAGPDSFDCSGLTMYAWAAAGVSLPHNSDAQYAATHVVPVTEREPGDLVFFGTTGNLYHVGIYIGNDLMIEAPHTGATVRQASIWRSDLYATSRPA